MPTINVKESDSGTERKKEVAKGDTLRIRHFCFDIAACTSRSLRVVNPLLAINEEVDMLRRSWL